MLGVSEVYLQSLKFGHNDYLITGKIYIDYKASIAFSCVYIFNIVNIEM